MNYKDKTKVRNILDKAIAECAAIAHHYNGVERNLALYFLQDYAANASDNCNGGIKNTVRRVSRRK